MKQKSANKKCLNNYLFALQISERLGLNMEQRLHPLLSKINLSQSD
jgi:hypothetical protein